MKATVQSAEVGQPLKLTTHDDSLNAFEVLNLADLTWDVRLYHVRPVDGKKAIHGERGSAKNAFWGLRKQYASRCTGFGFVIDVSPTILAVSANWQVPADDVLVDGFVLRYKESITTSVLGSTFHRKIVEGIIREAIKNHFKNNSSTELGELWQEYNSFCQSPSFDRGEEFAHCRRFNPVAKFLCDGRLVIELNVNTISVDARTMSEYYREGDVGTLADRIEAKRGNRLSRNSLPPAVNLLHSFSKGSAFALLELTGIDAILGHSTLSRQEQQSLAGGNAACRKFPRDAVPIKMDELRLVLDSQITQESHDDTIIDPAERDTIYRHLRNFLDEIEVFGRKLTLADACVKCDGFEGGVMRPPSIRVRDRLKGETRILAPCDIGPDSLSQRTRLRAKAIRENGFLQSRPINPVVAVPKWFSKERARRMASDLQHILKQQGIDNRFEYTLYRDAHELSRSVNEKEYDAAVVVLPERSRQAGNGKNDTHEAIKREMSIPTQCIHYDNTLPDNWVNKSHQEFRNAEPRLLQRISQRYELCLSNLLVKHHWVPFAPAEPFHYNVHVGIDVGGRYNNTAMLCIGHGFSDPESDIVFLADEIVIDVQKAEPIPTESLFQGLLRSFQSLRVGLNDARSSFDLDRVLFIRDGHLLGEEDIWNELDALERLYKDFLERGWIDDSAVWTAVEVLKSAEGWRLVRDTANGPENPVVGRYVFPFDDADIGLICTTGQPYLRQGTACPLRIRIRKIAGQFSRTEVVRDLVWEADMCFTKLDMGMRLPWVLNVADTGALQVSRKYQITGITA